MKKALSPVIATSLFIVVVVVTVVGFQTWFNDYESKIFVNIESEGEYVKVEALVGNILYIRSSNDNFSLNSFKVTDIVGVELCSYSTFTENNDEGLVAYWNFDGDLNDSTLNENHGICSNPYCPEIGIGIKGSAYEFESHTVNFGNIFNLGLNNWTYSLWIKTNRNSTKEYILSKGAGDGWNGTRIWMGSSTLGRVIFGPSFGPWIWADGFYSLDDGGWHNIIVVINRNENITFYSDGITGQSKDISLFVNDNISNNQNLFIGGGSSSTYFNGSIDEIKIWNRPLSENEVKQEIFYSLINSNSEITKINLVQCNLSVGETYKFVGFTNNQILEQNLISK